MSELDSEIAILDLHKHWTIKTMNRADGPRRYQCTVWGDGKRVSASGASPAAAAFAALEKLRLACLKPGTPSLKVFR